MSALQYLLATRIKNRLRLLLKKPVNWIVMLAFVALLLLPIFTSSQVDPAEVSYRNPLELMAMMSALYVGVFATSLYAGIQRGASLYAMPDVQLLFPAPIPPRRVLIYGLVQQMGTSLMVGFFLLFQYNWMHSVYGIGFPFVLLVLLGYALTLFAAQVTAIALFDAASGHAGRKRAMKAVLLSGVALLALWTLWRGYAASGDRLPALAVAANEWPVLCFPVAGWLSAMVQAISRGEWMRALLPALGWLAYVGALWKYLSNTQSDYYEDVLRATEVAYNVRALQKSGQLQENVSEHVKVGREGLGRGWGASALFAKHRLESRRARRFLFETNVMIFLCVILVYSFVMRETGIAAIFIFATYMQLFSVGTGRWVRELTRQYVYLIPESPFRKLLYCLTESVIQMALEAAVLFSLVGLILQLPLPTTLAAIAARFSYALLLIGGNMVVDKILSGLRAKMLVLLAYFLITIVLALPGIALAIVLTAQNLILYSTDFTILLALTAANLVVAPIALYACRNALSNAEMNAP